jgi:hypothetical protein
MTARFVRSLALGTYLLNAVLSAAQTPPLPQGSTLPGPPRAPMPARDGTSPVPTGTGRIRGRVVSADVGNPLRRAQVRVSAPELRVNRSATTDADGRYEIADLPAGRYSISVSRNGYVSLQFGQQRPFEPGRPLDLGDGQLMDRIDFALPRGSVITGRITDETGEPMASVRVQAMRYQYLPTGQRQLVPLMGGPAFSLVTNDLGEFRVYGLMPGTYLVGATYEDRMIAPFDAGPTPRGNENDGFAVTYYPGTVSSGDAQPVTLGIAEEAVASFALVPARMTRISGLVRNSLGRPVVGVFLAVRTGMGMGMMMSRGGSATGVDGSFTINNLAPGEHWIEVYPRSSGDEWASVPISLPAGGELTNLVITTSPGATISGQVIFEGTSTSPKPDRIIVTAPEPGGSPPSRGMDDSGVIDASGRFQLKGVTGRALFRATQLAPTGGTWAIKSVTLNGVDLTDTPLDIAKSGDISGVEIVVSDKQTTFSGSARNARGEPSKDYTVVTFPDRLKEGALPARFIRVLRPDQQGRFETRGLPPGDYLAVAVDALEQGGQWDPEFRKRVEPSAKRFRLSEGQTASVDLQLIP